MATNEQKKKLLKAKIAVALHDELGRVPKKEEIEQVFLWEELGRTSPTTEPTPGPKLTRDEQLLRDMWTLNIENMLGNTQDAQRIKQQIQTRYFTPK